MNQNDNQQDTEAELLDCPFCGSEVNIYNPFSEKARVLYSIAHKDTGCILSTADIAYFRDKEDMIEKWNKKASGIEDKMSNLVYAKYPKGMTVRDLKNLVNSLPEINSDTGEGYEVWIETGKNRSSPVKEVMSLNARKNGSDIIFIAGIE